VQQIGMKKDIVGQTIRYNHKNYTVVGVIKDMVMESPYSPVRPTIFFDDVNSSNIITISIQHGIPLQDALSKIAAVYKKYNAPFDYTFNDEAYQQKFAEEQRVGNLATFFTILAIFISCLGLFGLASFVAEQRKKEIGVRKVLGASVFNVWQLLSKEFAVLVMVSLLIAAPLAGYFMHGWLQHYQYRVALSWWIFAAAGAGALMITLLTVSYQAIKAAIANPVKSLRTE
jgi:putative ABC transport system permease protein